MQYLSLITTYRKIAECAAAVGYDSRRYRGKNVKKIHLTPLLTKKQRWFSSVDLNKPFKFVFVVGNGVETAFIERITTKNPPYSQGKSGNEIMFLERLDSVNAACRRKNTPRFNARG